MFRSRTPAIVSRKLPLYKQGCGFSVSVVEFIYLPATEFILHFCGIFGFQVFYVGIIFRTVYTKTEKFYFGVPAIWNFVCTQNCNIIFIERCRGEFVLFTQTMLYFI